MRILIAEDDPISRRLLEVLLDRWGHEVVSASDGAAAWQQLNSDQRPRLAILDWMMPKIDGLELCRRIRDKITDDYIYIIMLTARENQDDIIIGLESGADDYVTKPFDHSELQSRIKAGLRILSLKNELSRKVTELEDSLEHVKQLQGIIPICMHCHKIRDEGLAWHRLEEYIQQHSEAVFTHALCDECLEKHYPEVAEDKNTK